MTLEKQKKHPGKKPAVEKPAVERLEGEAGLGDMVRLRTILCRALETGNDFTIDASAVREPGILFVQLLISARRAAAARNIAVALTEPASGALYETLNRGGFLTSADKDFWLCQTGEPNA